MSDFEGASESPAGNTGDSASFGRRIGRYGRAKWANEQMAALLIDRAEAELDRLMEAGRVVPEGSGSRGRETDEHWWGQSSMARRGEKLRDCATELLFRWFFTLPEQPIKLAGGRFCRQPLLCQWCALGRSSKLVRAYVPKIATLVESGLQAWFFSGTLRNGEDLGERFKLAESSLSRLLTERRDALRNGSRHPWVNVCGGVFSFEAKRGEGTRGGLWHPHVHGVLLLDDLPYDASFVFEALQRWCELTGESDIRGQYLRPLRATSIVQACGGSEAFTEGLLCDTVGQELLEVFKYPLKVSALEPADRWEAFEVLSRRRLIRSFGCLWGVEPPASMLDQFDSGDLPYLQLLMRYQWGQGVYGLAGRRLVAKRGFSLDSGSLIVKDC